MIQNNLKKIGFCNHEIMGEGVSREWRRKPSFSASELESRQREKTSAVAGV